MTEEQILARWKSMAGDTSAEPWTHWRLAGFFQMFRPHGEGVAAVFDDVAGGEEILPRLMEVYAVTGEGWTTDDAFDMYFIVRKPGPLSKEAACQLATSHLERMAEVGRAIGDKELAQLLVQLPRVEAVAGETPWPPGQDDPESLIYTASTDFLASLTPMESHAHLLGEGLYHIACFNFIRDYILWPLYRHSTAVVEPFQPEFELWKHGAGIRFEGERLVKVYVPRLEP